MARKSLRQRKVKKEENPQLQKEVDELLEIAERIGIQVRFERGYFLSGSCSLDDQSMIIINRKLSLDSRIQVLLKELSGRDLEDVFIRPDLREKITNVKENS